MAETRWEDETGGSGGANYAKRFADLAASGAYLHGEADFVSSLVTPGALVLDAGCGTGRVAIELSRRGYSVMGVDLDRSMLDQAELAAPTLDWRQSDLTQFWLRAGDELVDVALLAGNVMIYLAPGTEGTVLKRISAAVKPGGLVVAGFSLGRLSLDDYDQAASEAGLVLVERFSTWDSEPITVASNYAVSVHRRDPSR